MDSEVISDQKSLEWKTTDDEENPQTYMQLYGMDLSGEEHVADLGISGAAGLLDDGYQFVVRKNGAGGEIDYLTLSVCLSSLSGSVSAIVSAGLSGLSPVPPDSSVEAAGLSSVQVNELDGGEKVLELYNFHALRRVDPLSTDDIVIRRANHVDYVSTTSLSSTLSTSIVQIVDKEISGKGGVPPDADVPAANISSVQTYGTGSGKVLELFQFHQGPAAGDGLSVRLTEQPKPLLEGNSQFLVRTIGQNGARTLEYKSISAAASGGGGTSFPGPFEMTLSGAGAGFTNCVMRVARAYFFYGDMSCDVPAGDQMVFSVLQHSETPSVTVSAGPYADIAAKLGTDWSNLLSTTVTPLYRVTDGEVACDYRYMMNVQAYDSRNYQYWAG